MPAGFVEYCKNRILEEMIKAFKLFPLTLVFGLICSGVVVGQEPATSPSPLAPTSAVEQSIQVPPVASDFHPDPKPLPEMGRVGVDMGQQRPLSLREALAAALENNKDIEVARQNVKIAELIYRVPAAHMTRASALLLFSSAS